MFDNLIEYIGRNFGNPNGTGGKIATMIMNVINQKQYNAVLKNITNEDKDILDIGFGNGYLIKKILKNSASVNIWGIEISQDMIDRVLRKNVGERLHLLLENINETSFKDNVFDKIYTVNTIYFWTELEKSFSEIKRILKPNGIFINAIYTKEYLDKIVYTKYGFNKYSLDEIIKITEDNGMKIKKIVEIKKNKSYCIISENV